MVRPWKPPRKPMKRGRPRDVARQLERALHRLGAALADEAHHRLAHRLDARACARPAAPVLVPVVAGDVQELVGRLLDRLHHLRVRMPGGAHGDAGREVEEAVAVHVPDLGAAAVRHHERIVARIRGRDDVGVARKQRAGLGAGKFGLDVRVVSRWAPGVGPVRRAVARGAGAPRACARAARAGSRVRAASGGAIVSITRGHAQRPADRLRAPASSVTPGNSADKLQFVGLRIAAAARRSR